ARRGFICAVAARTLLQPARAVMARAAMAAAPAVQRETVRLVVVPVLAVAMLRLVALLSLLGLLRSAAGDEGRQPVDVAADIWCNRLVRAWRTVLKLGGRKRLRVGRQIRLRFAGPVSRLARVHRRLLPNILLVVVA